MTMIKGKLCPTVNIGTFFADDDNDIHDLVAEMLDEIGWTNHSFYSRPEDLLDNLDTNVNIVVIDHYYNQVNTGMDGIKLLKEVKKLNKWSYAIIFSGQVSKKIVVDYLNAGADRYVDKEGKDPMKYFEELIYRMKEGIDVAKERIKILEALNRT